MHRSVQHRILVSSEYPLSLHGRPLLLDVRVVSSPEGFVGWGYPIAYQSHIAIAIAGVTSLLFLNSDRW